MKRAKQTKDVLELAHSIFSIAIGEEESHEENKDRQAVARGARGGKTRAASLPARKRKQIAKKAAQTRWSKSKNSPLKET